MEDSYTYNQIISLLYRESSAEKVVETFDLIKSDADAGAFFNAVRSAKNQLPNVLFEPAATTLQSILDYSARGVA